MSHDHPLFNFTYPFANPPILFFQLYFNSSLTQKISCPTMITGQPISLLHKQSTQPMSHDELARQSIPSIENCPKSRTINIRLVPVDLPALLALFRETWLGAQLTRNSKWYETTSLR
jgi:hypothetical protein